LRHPHALPKRHSTYVVMNTPWALHDSVQSRLQTACLQDESAWNMADAWILPPPGILFKGFIKRNDIRG
jgi:hypothetical protein